ncbi:GRP domain-containing protein [Cephalotus follicularis]|uniref:GRP domain-containing protein n=1 Tax=Cephalotus follicularis TaxID=3775 RepID=A0A1Q3D842_CEPFO|nr:GRP domain-containing protein [Cephalotus follicularis]
MGFKFFLLLALAIVLLISSNVVARDLAETSTVNENEEANKETKGVNDEKYGGWGGYGGYGGGGRGYGGYGGYGGRGGGWGGGGGGYGGYGGYGGGGYGGYGRGRGGYN